MPTTQPRFCKGAIVRRTNQPDAVGVVRKSSWNSQTDEWEYAVQFGAQLRAVPESSIEPFEEIETPWEALSRGKLSGIDHFIFSLTLHRLRQPPARITRSFATARTLFYPHQFKPLLKFLDNRGKRIFIADDVGLGKTIEAGYILRELEAHEPIERVLIVVPARLQPKWKRELETRFNETFDIVKGSDLTRLAERMQTGRELDAFRWIVSYESIRPDEVREALDSTRLPLDVLIFDEAHRLRNPDTLQHKVGSILCEQCADTVIMLSATPVQNRLEDLWHLLRLLSREEFSEWPVFQDQISANRFLLRAQQLLAGRPPDFLGAQTAVNSFLETSVGKAVGEAGFARSVRERLSSPPITKNDLIELQLDLDRLSPLGHILSRTRKSEAITNRAERDATWTRISLSPAERAIYDSVEGICRAAWPRATDSWGFRMSLLMAYRITASCIPAAMHYFAERLGGQAAPIAFSAEIEEQEQEGAEFQDVSAWSGHTRNAFLQVVHQYESSAQPDSKLKCFVDELQLLWSSDEGLYKQRRKVVVFSFFRRTLEYLAHQLSSRRIMNCMIHGGIPISDREVAIDDFLQNPDVLVLLTSEVGGEGLDLQAASVVINYDLPWNPMVVEQRIGRVDRIGQEAERIVIRNLIIEDSIEESVLQRLLEKIEIFRSSIGELDEIIGEEIESLTQEALQGNLSKEELKRVVEERGDVLARRVQEAKQVLSRVDGLLAADQAMTDEIKAVIGERQIPAEKELLLFLNRFLASRFSGCQLPSETLHKVMDVDLRSVGMDLEGVSVSLGGDAVSFARRLVSGRISVTLSRQAAYAHMRSELLHLHHPLVRYAVDRVVAAEEHRSSAFSLCLKTDVLPEGVYGFMIAGIHIHGYRPKSKLVATIAAVNCDSLWIEPEFTTPLLIQLLDNARDWEGITLPESEVEMLRSHLTGGLQKLKIEWGVKEERLDQARSELQAATRRATLEFLVNRAKSRMDGLIQRGAAEFAIRMARFRLEKLESERSAAARAPEVRAWGGVEHEELGVGLLQVQREGSRD